MRTTPEPEHLVCVQTTSGALPDGRAIRRYYDDRALFHFWKIRRAGSIPAGIAEKQFSFLIWLLATP
jgi:hypothetical protein